MRSDLAHSEKSSVVETPSISVKQTILLVGGYELYYLALLALFRTVISPFIPEQPIITFLVFDVFAFLPIFLYLRASSWSYLRLMPTKKIWWGLAASGLILELIITDIIVNHKYAAWLPALLSSGNWLVILISGLEEIPFRGWMFQKLHERIGLFWPAAIISSLLFACAHLPNYLFPNTLVSVHAFDVMLFGLVSTFVGGVCLCGLFYKSQTIWSGILFHIMFDVLVAISQVH